jgi:hypothetical protein
VLVIGQKLNIFVWSHVNHYYTFPKRNDVTRSSERKFAYMRPIAYINDI